MSLTRRGFLWLLASSIAAAKVGITIEPSTQAVGKPKKLVHARHLCCYVLYTSNGLADYFSHRIDVKWRDPDAGFQQWGIDVMSKSETLTARELEPALASLNKAIGEMGYEIGEIHSYSMEGWQSNREAQARWSALT